MALADNGVRKPTECLDRLPETSIWRHGMLLKNRFHSLNAEILIQPLPDQERANAAENAIHFTLHNLSIPVTLEMEGIHFNLRQLLSRHPKNRAQSALDAILGTLDPDHIPGSRPINTALLHSPTAISLVLSPRSDRPVRNAIREAVDSTQRADGRYTTILDLGDQPGNKINITEELSRMSHHDLIEKLVGQAEARLHRPAQICSLLQKPATAFSR